MSARPLIKVCGMTRLEDAELAVELGAWAVGFIFHAASPRATTPENAGRIIRKISGVKTVGVFVDARMEEIRRAALESGISTIQLHGAETADFCGKLKALLPQISIIRALRLKDRSELALIAPFRASCEAALLDTYVPGVQGGTGVTGDWTLTAEAAKKGKIILAGGLNPGNIRAALKTPAILAVDVSSGVEESPGRKSFQKMTQFFANAQGEEISA